MSKEPPPLHLDLIVDDDLDATSELPESDVLERWALAALRDDIASEVCLRVVSTATGRDLNHQYRDRDYATNVLSFPSGMPALPDGVRPLGDLVICASVLEREATEQGKTLTQHWAHLVVHGMLHLQGMDHVIESDAQQMEAAEVAILAGLGLPDPYRESDNEPRSASESS